MEHKEEPNVNGNSLDYINIDIKIDKADPAMVEQQVQQQQQQSESLLSGVGDALSTYTDFLVIDTIVDGVVAIGAGLIEIIGSMFD